MYCAFSIPVHQSLNIQENEVEMSELLNQLWTPELQAAFTVVVVLLVILYVSSIHVLCGHIGFRSRYSCGHRRDHDWCHDGPGLFQRVQRSPGYGQVGKFPSGNSCSGTTVTSSTPIILRILRTGLFPVPLSGV